MVSSRFSITSFSPPPPPNTFFPSLALLLVGTSWLLARKRNPYPSASGLFSVPPFLLVGTKWIPGKTACVEERRKSRHGKQRELENASRTRRKDGFFKGFEGKYNVYLFITLHKNYLSILLFYNYFPLLLIIASVSRICWRNNYRSKEESGKEVLLCRYAH